MSAKSNFSWHPKETRSQTTIGERLTRLYIQIKNTNEKDEEPSFCNTKRGPVQCRWVHGREAPIPPREVLGVGWLDRVALATGLMEQIIVGMKPISKGRTSRRLDKKNKTPEQQISFFSLYAKDSCNNAGAGSAF